MVGKPMTYQTRFGDVPRREQLQRVADDITTDFDEVSSYGFIEQEFDTDAHEQTMDEVRGIH